MDENFLEIRSGWGALAGGQAGGAVQVDGIQGAKNPWIAGRGVPNS
jgi:hypothetical protein